MPSRGSPDSDPRPPVRLEPGFRLDRYELLAPFATGGMAAIWLARMQGKHGFERLVAVKTILPEYALVPEFRKMLLDEAAVAARVRHANVTSVLDVGDEKGVLYIVMDWVNGDSLQAIHRALQKSDQLIPLPIVVRCCADASRGLHAAHELRSQSGEPLGVVHRDVSPHNILVDADGTGKIIDFGIAKARERLAGRTTTGTVKGKARYMPPEQVLAEGVDRRTDVWAMGAVLQHLLTGRTPYSGTNDLATLHKIMSRDPPEPLAASVPEPLASVIKRALALEPAQRFATAEDLANALDEALIALGSATNVTHVKTFLETSVPALAEHRRKTVDLALSAAENRADAPPRAEDASSVPVASSIPQRARAPRRTAAVLVALFGISTVAIVSWVRPWERRPAVTAAAPIAPESTLSREPPPQEIRSTPIAPAAAATIAVDAGEAPRARSVPRRVAPPPPSPSPSTRSVTSPAPASTHPRGVD
jgi:serine/threonine protein kinase